MKYCRFCGQQIDDDSVFCSVCGKNLGTEAQAAPVNESQVPVKAEKVQDKLRHIAAKVVPFLKKPYLWGGIAVVAVAVAAVWFLMVSNCNYSGCNNKPVSGSDYCYTHKCAVATCNSSHYSYSNYCYYHYLLYDDDAGSSGSYVSSSDLVISSPSITSGYSYTYAEGTIKNNSSSTVEYVKIKGAFTDSSGNVIDTDWTYAVGSEGLAPGESCKWKMSVDKDYRITKCKVSIMDFDY